MAEIAVIDTVCFFFFQAEDGIRDVAVTGVQTCALPIYLAAQGQMATVLIYSPDRLSRKYAYQVLLTEELSRCGVEIVFLKSPAGGSPEDQLVVQFQGMIAEYERAQIAERSRRGKRSEEHTSELQSRLHLVCR